MAKHSIKWSTLGQNQQPWERWNNSLLAKAPARGTAINFIRIMRFVL